MKVTAGLFLRYVDVRTVFALLQTQCSIPQRFAGSCGGLRWVSVDSRDKLGRIEHVSSEIQRGFITARAQSRFRYPVVGNAGLLWGVSRSSSVENGLWIDADHDIELKGVLCVLPHLRVTSRQTVAAAAVGDVQALWGTCVKYDFEIHNGGLDAACQVIPGLRGIVANVLETDMVGMQKAMLADVLGVPMERIASDVSVVVEK